MSLAKYIATASEGNNFVNTDPVVVDLFGEFLGILPKETLEIPTQRTVLIDKTNTVNNETSTILNLFDTLAIPKPGDVALTRTSSDGSNGIGEKCFDLFGDFENITANLPKTPEKNKSVNPKNPQLKAQIDRTEEPLGTPPRAPKMSPQKITPVKRGGTVSKTPTTLTYTEENGETHVLTPLKDLGMKGGEGEVIICRLGDTSETFALKSCFNPSTEMKTPLKVQSRFLIDPINENGDGVLMKAADADLLQLINGLKMLSTESKDPQFSQAQIHHFFVNMFLQMGLAVHAINRNSECHRDVKPENFLVFGREVRLCDFGLVTKHSPIKDKHGTLVCMAPEQFAGVSYDLDITNRKFTPATDAFGLGTSFFKILTGIYYFQINPSEKIGVEDSLKIQNFLSYNLDALSNGTDKNLKPILEKLPQLLKTLFEDCVLPLLKPKPCDRLNLDELLKKLNTMDEEYSKLDETYAKYLKAMWTFVKTFKK